VLDACAPRSGVEYTPAGSTGLAVLKVLVETQNEESVAAVSPFVPFKVALLEVIEVAGFVVGAVAAKAEGTAPNPGLNALTTNAKAASAETDLVMRCNILLFIYW
jgi:hypothetical protein